jgi:hypothetical protein
MPGLLESEVRKFLELNTGDITQTIVVGREVGLYLTCHIAMPNELIQRHF